MAGRKACTRARTVGWGECYGSSGWTKAVGWAVRSAGGSTGPGERSCPMLRGLGDTELEGDVVLSRSRRVPGRV